VKLRIVWVGKTKDADLTRLIVEFHSRIQRWVSLELVELKDPRAPDSVRTRLEADKILAALDGSDRVVVLDPEGKMWTSQHFAGILARHLREDPRRLTFVIGGYSGLSEAVKQRADMVWSLSPLTFTHELCRVLLLEQIYRAFCIIHKHPYSK
jgi:23S rRNA (pseudouridine1915-N3)-methyltransferase